MIKKIFTMLSAFAMVGALASTASAVEIAESSIEPVFFFEAAGEVDGEYAYDLKVTYDGDDMSAAKKSGKWSGTAFTMIQVEFDHPEEEAETVWIDSEYVTGTQMTGTHTQGLFNGGNGTYLAVPSGDVVCTVYSPSEWAVDDIEINFVLSTIDTFEKNVSSIQTKYSTRESDIVGGSADYIAYINAKGGDDEELPADRSAAVSFSANENTFVNIALTNKGDKNFFLPAGVKGDATVYGLLKYTVNAEDANAPAKGDIFTIKAVDMETKAETVINTITVE